MHFLAMSEGKRSFYTAPIKALVSEKFFALCRDFGAGQRRDADGRRRGQPRRAHPLLHRRDPREHRAPRGEARRVDCAVIDEFHYYADRDRGVAWQVPLLVLEQTQFLLMSATIGPTEPLREGADEAHAPPDGDRAIGATARCRSSSSTARRRSTRRSSTSSRRDARRSTSSTSRSALRRRRRRTS